MTQLNHTQHCIMLVVCWLNLRWSVLLWTQRPELLAPQVPPEGWGGARSRTNLHHFGFTRLLESILQLISPDSKVQSTHSKSMKFRLVSASSPLKPPHGSVGVRPATRCHTMQAASSKFVAYIWGNWLWLQWETFADHHQRKPVLRICSFENCYFGTGQLDNLIKVVTNTKPAAAMAPKFNDWNLKLHLPHSSIISTLCHTSQLSCNDTLHGFIKYIFTTSRANCYVQ